MGVTGESSRGVEIKEEKDSRCVFIGVMRQVSGLDPDIEETNLR